MGFLLTIMVFNYIVVYSWYLKYFVMEDKPEMPVLKFKPEAENPSIKALDGKLKIAEARQIFRSHIDLQFSLDGLLSNPGQATVQTALQIAETTRDAKFREIFGAWSGSWEQKCLTQNQIIEICSTLKPYLPAKATTMFLCKINEFYPVQESNPESNLMVVFVIANSDGLRVYCRDLNHKVVWLCFYHHLVFSPALVLK